MSSMRGSKLQEIGDILYLTWDKEALATDLNRERRMRFMDLLRPVAENYSLPQPLQEIFPISEFLDAKGEDWHHLTPTQRRTIIRGIKKLGLRGEVPRGSETRVQFVPGWLLGVETTAPVERCCPKKYTHLW